MPRKVISTARKASTAATPGVAAMAWMARGSMVAWGRRPPDAPADRMNRSARNVCAAQKSTVRRKLVTMMATLAIMAMAVARAMASTEARPSEADRLRAASSPATLFMRPSAAEATRDSPVMASGISSANPPTNRIAAP
ncbi:MAG: hypothetical protein NTZ98_16155 [Acidobacteria bacterium]|nr:hypothetical protein [Acidobacteriota bacterium]